LVHSENISSFPVACGSSPHGHYSAVSILTLKWHLKSKKA